MTRETTTAEGETGVNVCELLKTQYTIQYSVFTDVQYIADDRSNSSRRSPTDYENMFHLVT